MRFNNISDEADFWYLLGTRACEEANLDYAYNALNKALELYEMDKNLTGAAEIHRHLGDLYTAWREYTTAIRHYQQSLTIFRDQQSLIGIANALIGLGDVASIQERLELGLHYYEEALTVYQTLGPLKK